MSAEVRATEIRQAIERFLETSQDPMLCEPGEESLAITPENFALEVRGGCAQLQAWDQKRNLVRRVSAIERASLFSFGPGRDVRTCSAEDLIVFKLFASRPLDRRKSRW